MTNAGGQDEIEHFRSVDRNVDVEIDAQGVVRQVRGALEVGVDLKDLPATAIAFLTKHARAFGDVDHAALSVIRSGDDAAGGSSVTYGQTISGIVVEGGVIRFHARVDGTLDSVSNDLLIGYNEELDPSHLKITAPKAQEIARRVARDELEPGDPPKLLIRKDGPLALWRIRLVSRGEAQRTPPRVVEVDAHTGDVIDTYIDRPSSWPYAGRGRGYYSGSGALPVLDAGGVFQLLNIVQEVEIWIREADTLTVVVDPDGVWKSRVATPRSSHQGPEVDAHRYGASIVDYFYTEHGYLSYDGRGSPVNIVVHSPTDGGYWDTGSNMIVLGDGADAPDNYDYPTCIEYVAHEFVHGVIQSTCHLYLAGESGALHEAFCDVFAALSSGHWTIFAEAWRGTESPAVRNLKNPTNGIWDLGDPDSAANAEHTDPNNSCERRYTERARDLAERGHGPDHYGARYVRPCRPVTMLGPRSGPDALDSRGYFWDSGGVHANSQIIGHLFHLLVHGGTHRYGAVVEPVGSSIAGRLLFHCAHDLLVGRPRAAFADFRWALGEAANDLYGGNAQVQESVQLAIEAVGLPMDRPTACTDSCF